MSLRFSEQQYAAHVARSGTSKPAVAGSNPVAPIKNKWRNDPTVVDGIRFASKKEARQDAELVLRFHRGEIAELRRQVLFPLTVNGVLICDYVADWTYVEDGKLVVRDAKGKRTDVYQLKKKLMHVVHGVEIRET